MAETLNMVRQLISAVAGGGTGTLTLGAAATGFRDIAGAGGVDGKTYSYTILEGAVFESGRGHYVAGSPATFVRDAVLMSSTGAGNLQTFTNAAVLIITPLAEDVTSQDVLNRGNSGTATQTFDVSKSKVQKLTVTGAHTWAFTGWPPGYGEIEILTVNAGSAALTLPTINWLKGDGTTSTSFSSMGVGLASSGPNTFLVWTYDGGTTLYGRVA